MTPEQVRIFKGMTPARELELAAEFCHGARRLKTQGIRALHPEWPEERVRDRVRELFLHAAN